MTECLLGMGFVLAHLLQWNYYVGKHRRYHFTWAVDESISQSLALDNFGCIREIKSKELVSFIILSFLLMKNHWFRSLMIIVI